VNQGSWIISPRRENVLRMRGYEEFRKGRQLSAISPKVML
jgi:hypothetical protein